MFRKMIFGFIVATVALLLFCGTSFACTYDENCEEGPHSNSDSVTIILAWGTSGRPDNNDVASAKTDAEDARDDCDLKRAGAEEVCEDPGCGSYGCDSTGPCLNCPQGSSECDNCGGWWYWTFEYETSAGECMDMAAEEENNCQTIITELIHALCGTGPYASSSTEEKDDAKWHLYQKEWDSWEAIWNWYKGDEKAEEQYELSGDYSVYIYQANSGDPHGEQ